MSRLDSRLDALLNSHPLPTWRPAAWPIMILLAGLLAWSYVTHLEEVAVAMGKVEPLGKSKVIQHLEGGIIQEIYVREGDAVKEGASLLLLDLATAGLNREELQVRLDSELLVKARLEAEAEAKAVAFPADVAKRRPNLVESERQTFEARRRELASTASVLREQRRQKELEVEELEAKRRAVTRNFNLARERLGMSKSLLSEGLTAKMAHLELEAQVESLDGEMKALEPAIPRARAAVNELGERFREVELRFRREAQAELGKTEQSIARIRELLAQATQQNVRAEVKSPIDGVVKNMRYNTIGGVVKAGEAIMEIIPTGDNLVIDVKLNPTDRGYVEEGQDALIKISTYDYARYGGLNGRVARVAPDSSTDDKGIPFFRVVVEPEKTYLGASPGQFQITPGMEATVDIKTGTRTVLDYLVRPVLKLRHEAFRER
jgi:adhesin transport system membrane fusion protein